MKNNTKENLKLLKDKTGASILDCKKSLDACHGDFTKAMEHLKASGKLNKKNMQERKTKEGLIFSQIIHEKNFSIGLIFQLSCETDFVARTEEFKSLGLELIEVFSSYFKKSDIPETASISSLPLLEEAKSKMDFFMQKLGEKIEIENAYFIKVKQGTHYLSHYVHPGSQVGVLCLFDLPLNKIKDLSDEQQEKLLALTKDIGMQIVSMDPQYINSEDVDKEFIEKETQIIKDELKNLNKPEAILNQIIKGKLDQVCQSKTLLSQAFIKNPKDTVTSLFNQFEKEEKIKVNLKHFIHIKLGKEGGAIV